MRKLIIGGVSIILFCLTGVAGATTINFQNDLAGLTDNEKTSGYSYLDNFAIETFNHVTSSLPISVEDAVGLDQQLWTWSGSPVDSGSVVNGSTGQNAAPFGVSERDASNYLAVPNPSSNGSVVVDFGDQEYSYFGLWWGSIDTYNSITFIKDGHDGVTYGGADIINYAFGAQENQVSNLYVNFLGLSAFDSVRFNSTSYAFEVDNIAVGTAPVPEPATMLLFGTGLVGLVGSRLRKKK